MNYKTTAFAIALLLVGITVSDAQSSFFTVGGAHKISLAGSGSMYDGIASIYTNPAGIATVERYALDVSYDRRYNLSQLSTVSVAGVASLGKGAFGFSVAQFGSSVYSEGRIGLHYGRQLFDKVSVGGGFHYMRYDAGVYGVANRFTFELGVQSVINDKLSMGAYVFSPGAVALTDDQDVPSRFSLGAKYKVSKKADIYIDVSKTINRSPDFSFATDYRIADQFSIRAGANITQSSIHFGPAYHFSNGLSILGAYAFDNRLGHTTALSLSYVAK